MCFTSQLAEFHLLEINLTSHVPSKSDLILLTRHLKSPKGYIDLKPLNDVNPFKDIDLYIPAKSRPTFNFYFYKDLV